MSLQITLNLADTSVASSVEELFKNVTHEEKLTIVKEVVLKLFNNDAKARDAHYTALKDTFEKSDRYSRYNADEKLAKEYHNNPYPLDAAMRMISDSVQATIGKQLVEEFEKTQTGDEIKAATQSLIRNELPALMIKVMTATFGNMMSRMAGEAFTQMMDGAHVQQAFHGQRPDGSWGPITQPVFLTPECKTLGVKLAAGLSERLGGAPEVKKP